MLEQLRENKSSAIIYLLFGIIILAFVFTFNTSGGGGGACSGGDDFVAAEVDEVDVTMGNLKVAMQLSMPPNVDMDRLQKNPQLLGYIAQTHLFRLNQESEYLAFSANENIEENLAACAGLTNAEQLRSCYERILTSVALSNLTETITVSNAARELGFRISDTELSDFIREWAMGQDGSEEFDMESYSRLVQYGLGTSKQEFEELVRRELLRHKMIQYITAHTVVDDTIVDAFTKNLGDQVGVEALVVTSDSIAEGITVSEADAKAYAADAKNAEGLQSVYDERKSEFVKPDRVKLRGLFKKAQAPARIAAQSDAAKKTLWETERAAAKTAADALLTQLKETPAPPAEPGTPAPTLGERISDLTEQSDHGSSKAKGGDLGVLGQEEITKKYLCGSALAEAAFALNPNTLSEVIEVDDGFWIVIVEEKLAAEEKTLADVKDTLAMDILKKEASEKATESIAKELATAMQGQNDKTIDEVATAWNESHPGHAIRSNPTPIQTTRLEMGPTGRVSGSTAARPRIPTGCVPSLPKAAFELNEANRVASTPLAVMTGFECDEPSSTYLVMRWKESIPLEGDELATQRKEVMTNLSQDQDISAYQAWYRQLRGTTEVEVSSDFQEYLNQLGQNQQAQQ